MRTHYQNLKVAEDAPVEVIKAAWRALSQQHHPDKNHGNPKAVQIMQIINAAYEVLSDPVKRSAHDDAIKKFRASAPQPESSRQPRPPQHPQSPPKSSPQQQAPQPKVRQWWVWKNSKMTGPCTLAELAAQQRAGIINMQTYVCESGTDDAIPLHELLRRLNKAPVRGLRRRQSMWPSLLNLMASHPRITLGLGVYAVFLISKIFSGDNNSTSARYPASSYKPPPSYSSAPSYAPIPAYTPPPISYAPIPAYTPPPILAVNPPMFGAEALRESRRSSRTESSKSRYLRPLTAPNGHVWPYNSGYISGYPILSNDSYCEVTIDNTQRTSDVYAKVVNSPNSTVRNCFIKAGESFKMTKLTPGNYEIRYRDLDSGNLAKSEVFNLEVINTSTGISYSTLSLTLYTVRGGNTNMEPIEEKDF